MQRIQCFLPAILLAVLCGSSAYGQKVSKSESASDTKVINLKTLVLKQTDPTVSAIRWSGATPTNFTCLVYTPIQNGQQTPAFTWGYVIGTADNDFGRQIAPSEVSLGVDPANYYVFSFGFNSPAGSESVAGIAKFRSGSDRYIGYVVAQPAP